MIVYRLEHKQTRLGPYHHGNRLPHKELVESVLYDMLSTHKYDVANHPGPWNDFRSIDPFNCLVEQCPETVITDVLFGCPSQQALETWFDGYLTQLLEQEGFEIKPYQSINYILSDSGKQVAFIPNSFHETSRLN